MLQAAPQFTPQQLLDAGRRAEAEGKLDFAVQFYRHLADHYPHAPEAAEARHGLGRINSVQQQVWHVPANGVAHPPAHSGGRLQPARGHRRHVPHRDHYRTGRALAGLMVFAGWAMTVLGLALLPALFLLGAPVAYGLAAMLGMAAGVVAAGLLLVLMGQSARALFDQANASRELVALERAKASHE